MQIKYLKIENEKISIWSEQKIFPLTVFFRWLLLSNFVDRLEIGQSHALFVNARIECLIVFFTEDAPLFTVPYRK